MEFGLRIYDGDKVKDIPSLDKEYFSIGSGEHDNYQVQLRSISPEHFVIYKRNNKWFVRSVDSSVVSSDTEISDEDTFVLDKKNKLAVSIYTKSVDVIQDLDLRDKDKVIIGRSDKCDMVLPSKQVSGSHAVITRVKSRYYISDDDSRNGTFLNGKKLQEEAALQNGDIISICDFSIHYKDGILSIGDGTSEDLYETDKKIDYPYWFSPSPKLSRSIPVETSTIQNPPQMPTKSDRSVWDILASPGTMIVAMGLSALLGVVAPTSLILMVPMSVVSITLGLVNKRKAKKKFESETLEKNKKYSSYIEKMEQEIESKMEEQASILNYNFPSMEDCIEMVETKDIRMWNGRFGDADFMSVRLGTGDVDTSFEIKGPHESYETEDDEHYKLAKAVMDNAKYVKDVPISCSIFEEKLVGIVGNRRDIVKLVKNMLVSVSFSHSYEDLKIITVFSKKEKEDWDWVKWLPHSFSDDRDYRFVSGDGRPSELLKAFEDNLKQRSMENNGRDTVFTPYYLFVFTETELTENQQIMKYLLENSNLCAGALFLYDDIRYLPKECNAIIEVTDGFGKYIHKNDANKAIEFEIDDVEEECYENYARAMAPMRIPSSASTASLPSAITFLEGYEARTPEDLNIEFRWQSKYPNESMAVPVGIRANGEPFYFDIHEKQHGPHGMVAGMTGSGKSEMVQSWILSMALQFSPQDVSFVLIDFKGTGLILPFNNLPHLAGTISDLDSKIGRNLIALENELSRRKALLDKYGVNNINNYLKLLHSGKAEEPLPFLFVIIDEFAEFKVQFPEFMAVVDRIFAIGRTLGVFTILLTQKPAGVVNDKMNANTRFRWCLKVASSADSKEMLHHPDAAKITVPGRAYIQVGEDEIYELIQSYYSGATYRPDIEDKAAMNLGVSFVKENGERIHYVEEEHTVTSAEGNTSEINEVVNYISNFVENSSYSKASQIWMPKLPYSIPLEDVLEDKYLDGNWKENENEGLQMVAGMIDDPANQTQYPLVFDLTRDGHIALFGAPGTGKTNILQTMVMSLVKSYSPIDVNIYIMDFGGWSMGIFRNFPHVGGIANDNEDIKIEKMVQLLDRSLSERKQKFSEIGVGNLQAYKQATGEKLPNIVLFLDNFAPVLQLHPELDSFFVRLTREGGNYGIYFVVTTGTQMSLPYKINQNIKMSAAFTMADKNDYSGIVGKTGGLEPENREGRGLVKGAPPLEFQAALPIAGETEGDRVKSIRALADKMQREWEGPLAKALPIMPENIPYGSVRKMGSGIMLGLSTKLVEPVALPDNLPHYYPIVGFPGSGKTNMLRLLAKQVAELDNVTIVYGNLKQERMEGINCINLTTVDEIDDYFANLIPILVERKNIYEANTESVFDPIYLFMDDYKLLFDQLSEKTISRMKQIINLAEGLNVNLIISDNSDSFCKLSSQGEEVTMLMAKMNRAILIGGSILGYPVYTANMPSIEKSQSLLEHEAYVFENGNVTRIKTMFAE